MPLCRLNVAVNRCDHILPQAAVNEIALSFKLGPILGLKICLILGKQLLITLIGFLRAGKSAGGILQDIGVSCPGQLFCLLLLLFTKYFYLRIFLGPDRAGGSFGQRLLHHCGDLRLLCITDRRLL